MLVHCKSMYERVCDSVWVECDPEHDFEKLGPFVLKHSIFPIYHTCAVNSPYSTYFSNAFIINDLTCTNVEAKVTYLNIFCV